MENIKCVTCNINIECLCQQEQHIKPKHRTCWSTDEYPRATLNNEYIECHLCSSLCCDIFMKNHTKQFLTSTNEIHMSSIVNGVEYSISYDPNTTCKKTAKRRLKRLIKKNDKCKCGSGKKFENCCIINDYIDELKKYDFVTNENTQEYNDKCKLVKNIIDMKYRKQHIEYTYNSCGYMRIVINKTAEMSILPNNTWQEIDRNINDKLNVVITKELDICEICHNGVACVSCNKCAKRWCGECYINLFKTGCGVITCPYCRYSFGDHTDDDFLLNAGICEIRDKINSRCRMTH